MPRCGNKCIHFEWKMDDDTKWADRIGARCMFGYTGLEAVTFENCPDFARRSTDDNNERPDIRAGEPLPWRRVEDILKEQSNGAPPP